MPLIQSQLVKWSLPAFALILGLFWYRRRRVERVDPGGPDCKLSQCDLDSDKKTLREAVSANTPSNLSDSGIHTDESFSLSVSSPRSTEQELITCSPRKVSESLDIPIRRSSTLNNSRSWYNDELIETKLGSNPTANNFDSYQKQKSVSKNCDPITPPKVQSIPERETEKVKEKETGIIKTEKMIHKDDQETDQPPEVAQLESVEKVTQSEDQETLNKQSRTNTVSERDSANHSPVSGVMEGSVTDEARSEGSTDSGKGRTIKTKTKDNLLSVSKSIYEFAIANELVGRLIGKQGKSLQKIREASHVTLRVKNHAIDKEYKVCSISGHEDGIRTALELIRKIFPENIFPGLTLEPVNQIITGIPEELSAVPTQLTLIDSFNNDVIVCNIVSPEHFFLHLPTNPSYHRLVELDTEMTAFYESIDTPRAPDELWKDMVLVARWYDKWVRVSVERPDPEGLQTFVRLVDHGGFWNFSNAEMRKIHSNFLVLPFQAIEVNLAKIKPKGGEWAQSAYDIVTQLCTGTVALAHVEGYIDNRPYINLYFSINNYGMISLADELIARGYGEPASLHDVVPEQMFSIA